MYFYPQVIFVYSYCTYMFNVHILVLIKSRFPPLFPYWSCRLVVTDNSQCGAWNTWCSANKKPWNAKISHAEHPSRCDAVKFFLYLLSTEPYSTFDFKPTLYKHFQQLLGTPKKTLLLTDANFCAKVNPSHNC